MEKIMVIELTPDLEQALTAEAGRQGTSPELLALDTLREKYVKAEPPEDAGAEGTPYDLLKDYIGVVDSRDLIPGGAQMSTDTGRKFTEILLEKRRQGRM